MPDGEFFTGPIEDSVEGEVTFHLPAMIGGREVSGVHLRFEAGKVVDASAERGEEFLIKLLDTDDGARRLGELGIGTNYGIDRGTREVLLDEKIGGTVHMAVGASYPESGGVNESAVHTDLVCDLRLGGKLEVDGEVQDDGKFVQRPAHLLAPSAQAIWTRRIRVRSQSASASARAGAARLPRARELLGPWPSRPTDCGIGEPASRKNQTMKTATARMTEPISTASTTVVVPIGALVSRMLFIQVGRIGASRLVPVIRT